jgi:hypothetical protein
MLDNTERAYGGKTLSAFVLNINKEKNVFMTLTFTVNVIKLFFIVTDDEAK